jgi:hypothetical protein
MDGESGASLAHRASNWQQMIARQWPLFVLSLLLLVTAKLYAPSLHFGLMWDDPHWFGRVIGQPFGVLIRPMPDFHFYRPLVMVYNSLFINQQGQIETVPLHLAQIGWHLLNIALVYRLSRALGLGRITAVAAAALLAFHPFTYQAVAWAAPQQAMNLALLGLVWLTYLQARRQRPGWPRTAAASVGLFTAALLLQESSVLFSLIPAALEILRSGSGRWLRRDGNNWLAVVYPLLAAVFGLIWLAAPRQPGYTILAFDPRVSAYLLQGVVFPVWGRPWGYTAPESVNAAFVFAASVLTLVLLVLAIWRSGYGRLVLFVLVWIFLGLSLSIGGLRYDYVSIGPRLFYYAAPGVAILWACAFLPAQTGRWETKRRLVGSLLLTVVIAQSLSILHVFNRLYGHGTSHLTELVQAVSPEDEVLVFINFPDRYAWKRPPYPLGYWGVTLTPVVADLGEFPAIITGASPQTRSISMPWLNEAVREMGPYLVDMRGEITHPEELYALAQGVSGVYQSQYQPDGAFSLRRMGWLETGAPIDTPIGAPGCAIALFDDRLCLHAAVISPGAGQIDLELSWSLIAPAHPHDTIFVHLGQVGQEPVAQADGDPWSGALPLAVWQPGDSVHEQRIIALPGDAPPDQYLIRVGLYNWATGERYIVQRPDGQLWVDSAAVIGEVQWPP